MRKLQILLTVFGGLLMLGGVAAAQLDPNADGIGIYADVGGLINEVELKPNVPMEVYLVLTRPSGTQHLAGWECEIVVPENISIWGWNLVDYQQMLVLGTPPAFMAVFQPVPYSDAVHLMTFIIVPHDNRPAQFYIREYPGQSGISAPRYLDLGANYTGQDILIDLVPYPAAGEASFTVNPGALPVESGTWGGVKALYR